MLLLKQPLTGRQDIASVLMVTCDVGTDHLLYCNSLDLL